MGRTYTRPGMALAVAGLAAGGFALASGTPARAADGPTPTPAATETTTTFCSYVVVARTTEVHQDAGTQFRLLTRLVDGDFLTKATCQTKNGWVKILDPEFIRGARIRGGWVVVRDLKPVGRPSQAVGAGGGGTAKNANTLLPATGLGLIALGSGVVITMRRRRGTETGSTS
ncbi:MAG TPA: hypothetical protein VF069_04735 [Streptosporangiaceae bacterium]